MDSTLTTKVVHPPIKQLGFTVRDALQLQRRYSPSTIKEVSTAEESGEVEPWCLPVQWQQSYTPFQLATEPSTSSSELTTSTAFKGFKDCCEAGSFTLTDIQALHENGRLEVVGHPHTSSGVRSLVKSVVGGLRASQQPEPCAEGLGGTYFFLDETGRRKAIVKPCDEEPLAPNNPKGFIGRALGDPGLKPTVRIGEAAMREVAAYLLDYDHFANVPHTALVRVTHNVFHVAPEQNRCLVEDSSLESAMSCSQKSTASIFNNRGSGALSTALPSAPSKLASLQEFVQHNGDASEMGFSRFAVKNVHRIGILDLRLFNTDRHAGNMLVHRSKATKKGSGLASTWLEDQLELIPIDHGYCLPEALEPPYLEWLHWPQATIAFDEEELDYIARLDPLVDVTFLKQELPWLPEGSLRTLQVATLLLRKCAAAGLTLAEIGAVASRPLVGLEEENSPLENACLAARSQVDAAKDLYGSDFSEDLKDDELVDEEDSFTSSRPTSDVGRTGIIMGVKVPLETTISGDELLFDLEEECDGGPSSPKRNAPQSQSSMEAGSTSASLSPASPLVKGAPSCPPDGLAKSLATGMLHHKATHRVRNRQFKSKAAALKGSPTKSRRPGPAYPPPVVGAPASGLNTVWEGLDSNDWAAFMRSLEDLIQDALESGAWKSQPDDGRPGKGAFGMSCPRF